MTITTFFQSLVITGTIVTGLSQTVLASNDSALEALSKLSPDTPVSSMPTFAFDPEWAGSMQMIAVEMARKASEVRKLIAPR